MIDPVHGTHCEVCLKTVDDTFHYHECKFWHGIEYICQDCKIRLNETFGPKFVGYFEYTKVGCLFEEIKWAELRTNKTFLRPVKQ